jgi:hypothetical protein
MDWCSASWSSSNTRLDICIERCPNTGTGDEVKIEVKIDRID